MMFRGRFLSLPAATFLATIYLVACSPSYIAFEPPPPTRGIFADSVLFAELDQMLIDRGYTLSRGDSAAATLRSYDLALQPFDGQLVVGERRGGCYGGIELGCTQVDLLAYQVEDYGGEWSVTLSGRTVMRELSGPWADVGAYEELSRDLEELGAWAREAGT
jgi:hypothetical protein